MEEKFLILSDIHGNLSALESVLKSCSQESFRGVVLLGDLIDYGMRSNEVISRLLELESKEWAGKVFANIWGNHERLAIEQDLEHLSSDRGRVMAKYTRDHLTKETLHYIQNHMNPAAKEDFSIQGLHCLAVHGSLMDPFWKAVLPEDLRGDYGEYDIVFSGHSHYSQSFTHFYPSEKEELRNKKAVLFVNPGSVGQPRNQNPYAQYAVLSLPSKRVELRAVEYDIALEQSLFPDTIDAFYKERLTRGV